MKKAPFIVIAICIADVGSIAQNVYVANPFVQPNDSTLNWYGSGDVDGDDTLTWDDADRMQELIDGTFSDPEDLRLFDRADVNGDQVVDAEDRSMLEEHLNNEPFFQPKWYWNKLKSPEERRAWLGKMLAIDKTNEISRNDEHGVQVRDSRFYSNQTMINFHGFSDPADISNFNQIYPYDWQDNNRFNLPLLDVRIIDYDAGDMAIGMHEMNTIITGDEVKYWDAQDAVEPQTDYFPTQPGEQYIIGENARYYIRGIPTAGVHGIPGENLEIILHELICFSIKSGATSVFWPEPGDDLGQIVKRDTINPDISTSLGNGEIRVAGSSVSITITDAYPGRQWYSPDEGETIVPLSEGANTITLPDEAGGYSFLVYAGDAFCNEVLDTIDFTLREATGIHPGPQPEVLLQVYPNPAAESVTIRMDPVQTERIDIWDVSGRKMAVIHNPERTGEIQVDLSGFEPGYYTVVSRDRNGVINGRRGIVRK